MNSRGPALRACPAGGDSGRACDPVQSPGHRSPQLAAAHLPGGHTRAPDRPSSASGTAAARRHRERLIAARSPAAAFLPGRHYCLLRRRLLFAPATPKWPRRRGAAPEAALTFRGEPRARPPARPPAAQWGLFQPISPPKPRASCFRYACFLLAVTNCYRVFHAQISNFMFIFMHVCRKKVIEVII